VRAYRGFILGLSTITSKSLWCLFPQSGHSPCLRGPSGAFPIATFRFPTTVVTATLTMPHAQTNAQALAWIEVGQGWRCTWLRIFGAFLTMFSVCSTVPGPSTPSYERDVPKSGQRQSRPMQELWCHAAPERDLGRHGGQKLARRTDYLAISGSGNAKGIRHGSALDRIKARRIASSRLRTPWTKDAVQAVAKNERARMVYGISIVWPSKFLEELNEIDCELTPANGQADSSR